MDPSKLFHISRRSFIRRVSTTAAATGLPLWFVERELARAEEPAKKVSSPNERPLIALIGCGGMGTGDAKDALRFGDIVAVCDVDQKHLDRAVTTFAKEVNVWLPAGQRNGIRFEGSDGWIWVNRDKIEATGRELLSKPLPDDAERLYLSNDHKGNFFECIGSRKDPICSVDVGHRSASVCHLGAISLRTGKKLQWNSEKERFTGEHAAEANAYIARGMRKPYDYSFVA